MSDLENKAKKQSWFQGLQAEFQKVVWPDRVTLAKQTVAVTIISVLLGVLISIIDILVKYGIDFLVKL